MSLLYGGSTVKYNGSNCRRRNCNFAPAREPADTYPEANCNACDMPVRRQLAPVLVARIYNQPIVEEIPYSAMSLTVDNMTTVTNAYLDTMPTCGDCGCEGGFNPFS